jgi:hypothetical protein
MDQQLVANKHTQKSAVSSPTDPYLLWTGLQRLTAVGLNLLPEWPSDQEVITIRVKHVRLAVAKVANGSSCAAVLRIG